MLAASSRCAIRFERLRPSMSAWSCRRWCRPQGIVALIRTGWRRISSDAGTAEAEPLRGWENEVISSSQVDWSGSGGCRLAGPPKLKPETRASRNGLQQICSGGGARVPTRRDLSTIRPWTKSRPQVKYRNPFPRLLKRALPGPMSHLGNKADLTPSPLMGQAATGAV